MSADVGITLPFHEAVTVPINDLDCLIICNADMIRLYANDLSKFLVHTVNSFIPSPMSRLPHQPHIRELSGKRCWTFRQARVSQIR